MIIIFTTTTTTTHDNDNHNTNDNNMFINTTCSLCVVSLCLRCLFLCYENMIA